MALHVGGNGPGTTSIGSAVGGGTSGSVIYIDATGALAQNNANFSWDNTNFVLKVGATRLFAPATNNIFLGTLAGNLTFSGTNTIGIGNGAGTSLTAENDSVLIGYNCGPVLTGGAGILTAVGAGAMLVATTLTRSSAFGGNSQFRAVSGTDNASCGYASGSGWNGASSRNSAFGATCLHEDALYNDTTAIGFAAGYFNRGSENFFGGSGAGQANTTGVSVVYIGYGAGGGNQTGSSNVCVGRGAGPAAGNYSFCVFIGDGAGQACKSNGCTAVGYQSGFAWATLSANSTALGEFAAVSHSGSNSVFLGRFSGANATTGADLICIGSGSGVGAGSPTLSNVIVIGTGVLADVSSCIVIGTSLSSVMRSDGDGVCDLGSTTKRYKNVIASGYSTAGVQCLTKTAATYTVPVTEQDAEYDNNGAGAQVAFTLPASAVGLVFTFVVITAQNVRIVGNGTDTIRVAASTSTATTGHVDNATVGGVIRLSCHVAGNWIASYTTGTWTVT